MAIRRSNTSRTKKKDLGFQLILLAWPVIQFIIFYIYVNINSLRLAFNFGETNGTFFTYFATVLQEPKFFSGALQSVVLFLVCSVVSIPLSLLFAYYIYKKFRGGKLFRFLLFLPSIISATVLIVIFKKFTDIDLLVFSNEVLHTGSTISITNANYAYVYIVVIAFYIFLNFGTTTLIYSNKMSEISGEVIEASHLDGVNRIQEFWYIIIPSVWPTLSTFIVTSVATIFTNQYLLFTFFGSGVSGNLGYGPLGYIMFNTLQNEFLTGDPARASIMYHQMAALGLVITAVTIPLVFGTKALLKRFGPSEK